MLPTYRIRKLPGRGCVWEVIFKFENGDVEHWVGFKNKVEVCNWSDRKLLRIAAKQKQSAAA
jgi:hypothetical protein